MESSASEGIPRYFYIINILSKLKSPNYYSIRFLNLLPYSNSLLNSPNLTKLYGLEDHLPFYYYFICFQKQYAPYFILSLYYINAFNEPLVLLRSNSMFPYSHVSRIDTTIKFVINILVSIICIFLLFCAASSEFLLSIIFIFISVLNKSFSSANLNFGRIPNFIVLLI